MLHEAAHFICLDPIRRNALDTDAGSDDLEECAVCYLQILFAATLPGMGQARLLRDINAWGYSCRLGSTQSWFEHDNSEAQERPIAANLVDAEARPTYRRRDFS